jgi:hypothetical protein
MPVVARRLNLPSARGRHTVPVPSDRDTPCGHAALRFSATRDSFARLGEAKRSLARISSLHQCRQTPCRAPGRGLGAESRDGHPGARPMQMSSPQRSALPQSRGPVCLWACPQLDRPKPSTVPRGHSGTMVVAALRLGGLVQAGSFGAMIGVTALKTRPIWRQMVGRKPSTSVESKNWSMAPMGGRAARVRSVIAARQASVNRSASMTR